jgi:CubicO group peptidase (beta-lactamase class C family)
MKIKKLLIILVPLVILIIFLIFTENGKYFLRLAVLNYPDLNDYKKYPASTISKADNYFSFDKGETISIETDLTYTYKDEKTTMDLISLLKDTETTSFIVIRDDKIVFEEYYRGYKRNMPHILFSITKTFVSALIGLALEEGLINSIDEPVEHYIKEFRGKEEGRTTIRQLLTMTSGYRFNFADNIRLMYTFDIRKTAIKNIKQEETPGVHNHYNDYNYVLLGMVVEQATGMSVSEYFQKEIWQEIQAEYDALWTMDSKKQKGERFMSGLAVCPIDLAKFGRLYLNNGNWEGKQIIPRKWVLDSTEYDEEFRDQGDYYTKYTWKEGIPWFKKGGYYKYSWWGYSEDGINYSYTAEGYLGQVLYVSPQKNLIIVRTGNKWGDLDWWIDVVHLIAESLNILITRSEQECSLLYKSRPQAGRHC